LPRIPCARCGDRRRKGERTPWEDALTYIILLSLLLRVRVLRKTRISARRALVQCLTYLSAFATPRFFLTRSPCVFAIRGRRSTARDARARWHGDIADSGLGEEIYCTSLAQGMRLFVAITVVVDIVEFFVEDLIYICLCCSLNSRGTFSHKYFATEY
jgi:hypothetical protein